MLKILKFQKQKAFTLIELVTVIVILALLAVFAISRYFWALGEARASNILGVERAMQVAMALTKARAKLEGDTGAGTVTLEKAGGGTVSVTTTSQLVPDGTSSGIGAAIDLRDTQGEVTVTYTTPVGQRVATFEATNWWGMSQNCKTVYTETTASGAVAITTNVSWCYEYY